MGCLRARYEISARGVAFFSMVISISVSRAVMMVFISIPFIGSIIVLVIAASKERPRVGASLLKVVVLDDVVELDVRVQLSDPVEGIVDVSVTTSCLSKERVEVCASILEELGKFLVAFLLPSLSLGLLVVYDTDISNSESGK